MVLDYGMFFSKKTSICFLGDFMVVGRRTAIKPVRLRPALDSNHLLLHGSYERNGRDSYLARIARSPLHILRLKGSPKTSLKLYVMLRSKGRYSPEIVGTKRQEIVRRMIMKDEGVWRKVADTDAELFRRLSTIFGLSSDILLRDSSARNETLAFLESTQMDVYDREKVRRALQSREYKEAGPTLRIHSDFCTRCSVSGKMAEEYQRMMENIIRGSGKWECCNIEHPFYKEVELYNRFVACQGDLSAFDRRLPDCQSLNERGVRDYIASAIERYDATN
jgi:hypothetical protein